MRTLALVLLLMLSLLTATAQPNSAPPESAQVDGGTLVYQAFNRCSAAAATILLSHYPAFDGSYSAVTQALTPHAEDVSARLEETLAVAADYGLQGIARTGGTPDLLKVLIAAGYPVLMELSHAHTPPSPNKPFGDWMSHNTVLIGYDDNATLEGAESPGVFYFLDSMLGAGPDGLGYPVSVADALERWRHFNRGYVLLFDPADAAAVEALVGPDQWDAPTNAAHTLALADADLEAGLDDGFTAMNRGAALYALSELDAALESFDAGQEKGLPWRYFWYEFDVFETYLDAGHIDAVQALVRVTLADAPGVDELYYYIARAYLAQGETARAQANLEGALWRNPRFAEAQALLDEITPPAD